MDQLIINDVLKALQMHQLLTIFAELGIQHLRYMFPNSKL